jgi:hypothetical protein
LNKGELPQLAYRAAVYRPGRARFSHKSVEAVGQYATRQATPRDRYQIKAEYSGLPKSTPAKTTMRNFKWPFIGLSITTPLQ